MSDTPMSNEELWSMSGDLSADITKLGEKNDALERESARLRAELEQAQGRAELGGELCAILMGTLPLRMCTLGPVDALRKLIARASQAEAKLAAAETIARRAEHRANQLESDLAAARSEGWKAGMERAEDICEDVARPYQAAGASVALECKDAIRAEIEKEAE